MLLTVVRIVAYIDIWLGYKLVLSDGDPPMKFAYYELPHGVVAKFKVIVV